MSHYLLAQIKYLEHILYLQRSPPRKEQTRSKIEGLTRRLFAPYRVVGLWRDDERDLWVIHVEDGKESFPTVYVIRKKTIRECYEDFKAMLDEQSATIVQDTL